MSQTLEDKRKIAAKVFREAAEIVSKSSCIGCCFSINRAVDALEYRDIIAYDCRDLFADVFYKCETRRLFWLFGPYKQYDKLHSGYWFGARVIENREHRVLSLCLMADAVECGDFDDLLLRHWC